MTPLYKSDARSALCLLNWDTTKPVVDDGSYEHWLEGTRILQFSLGVVDFNVTRVATRIVHPDALSPLDAVKRLKLAGARNALIAGNYIEEDVIEFAARLIAASIEPTVLFDVCGTEDPMAKWQALAAIVDQGARVSTVQQTLQQISHEVTDIPARTRLLGILHEGLGEHAVELSAA